MSRAYNRKRTNLDGEFPIDIHKDLIIKLYATMNCNDVFRELRRQGFHYRLSTVSHFIRNLGIMRKPGGFIARSAYQCKLCMNDFEPLGRDAIYCYVCVPHGDRIARAAARKYSVSRPQLNAMLEEQQMACAICSTSFDNQCMQCIDHCHDTGRMRGILCQKCNFAIGLMKDNPKFLRCAAAYLERSQ